MKHITAMFTITVLAVAAIVAVSCGPVAAHAHAATAPQPKIETSLEVTSVHEMAATHHRRHHRSIPLRLRALMEARTQHGKPYVYGEDGPNGYDCSGLVMWAYHHAGGAGRRLSRDTYSMLAQVGTVLRRVRHPRRGDLAFFGTGHVELWLGKWHGVFRTYGAQHSGTVVGRHPISAWWHPSAYYAVVW